MRRYEGHDRTPGKDYSQTVFSQIKLNKAIFSSSSVTETEAIDGAVRRALTFLNDIPLNGPLPERWSKFTHQLPWLIFWILTPLTIVPPSRFLHLSSNYPELSCSLKGTADFLLNCRTNDGGFGSYPGICYGHALLTFAATASLFQIQVLLRIIKNQTHNGVENYFSSPDEGLVSFAKLIWTGEGFRNVGLEFYPTSIQAAYGITAAICIQAGYNFYTSASNFYYKNSIGLVLINNCLRFDGGFSSRYEASESHAGYTFCALATLRNVDVICGSSLFDNLSPRIREWLIQRQSPAGGFDGRANKLEDTCYATWCGGSLRLLRCDHWDSVGLRRWLLGAGFSKEPEGFRDKPGASPDPFHNCFGLMGLVAAGSDQLQKVDWRCLVATDFEI